MESNPKNILQIFASRSWGGGEQYVYDLSKKLTEDGHNVYFIHRKSPVIEKRIKTLNALSWALPLKNCFDCPSIIKISSIIKKYDIELIHCHQFKDVFIALFAQLTSKRKLKIILTRHLIKKAKTSFMYLWLYKNIDEIIFVSQLAKNEFLTSNPRIEPDKMVVIHNSITPIPYNTTINDIRIEYGIKTDSILLVFTGRIAPEKGINILIEALSKLKELNIYLLIIGKGKEKYEQSLRELAITKGVNDKIKFLGFVENTLTFLKQTDIGIAPSVWKEPFGLSIIEFMQMGKPVITTNNGAQSEYIANMKDGILIPPSDIEALSQTIRVLAENENLRLAIGEQARKTFEQKLSYPVFYNKILSVYNENRI